MILIEAGDRSDAAFAAKLMFAGQLRARGYDVGIDDRGLPAMMDRALKYEAAPFLVTAPETMATDLLIIGADVLSDATLDAIRTCGLDAGTRVAAVGRFPDHQAAIGARSKIAYALGREPEVLDLRRLLPRPLPASGPLPMAVRLAPAPPGSGSRPRLLVFLPPEQMRDNAALAALDMLASNPAIRLVVAVAGRPAERQGRWPGGAVTVLPHADLPPVALAGLGDLAAVCGHGLADDRVAATVLEMLGAGKPVIDCTEAAALISSDAPALQGPDRIAALPAYLDQVVLPSLAEINRLVTASGWLQDHSLIRIETALGLEPPVRRARTVAPPQTIFVPTNGVGLGHARRCALIASAMPDPAACTFAAFPSCVSLIEEEGFACLPLAQKSADHHDGFANDLFNYLRLGRLLTTGDKLVFDGGYIFESIFRTILEKRVPSIWIRRGLWQAGQADARITERARAFDRIVVPEEAFEDLNPSPGFDRQVRHVGPVVHQSAPEPGVRDALTARFGRPARELIVTMLGGGSAADRTAQLQTLCNLFEKRPDCLHLIVVWPGATIHPGLFGWRNSHVVQTRNALNLCQAADLVVTAAGYNSFHEMLYHRVPAIFVPQMAPFMDDQERRARAASDRGLAETVLAGDLLRLEREVRAFLEDGKAGEVRSKLTSAALPPPGNAQAATLIAEVGQG